jgi:hypothetical protein
MRIEIPFEIRYETPNTVPIEDVIDGLISAKLLIEEGGYNLAHFVPGLQIEQVQVSIRSVTQESPLRELLLVALYAATQKDLEKEVPALFELVTGAPVPEQFKTLLTLSVLVAVFYGISYAKDLITHISTDSAVKRQLSALVEDIAGRTGRTTDQIKKLLDERYKPKSKIKLLAGVAFKFFKPSKAQSNAPIQVNDHQISTEIVSDVPSNYAYEKVLETESARTFSNVDLELHAQDKDKEASGWAAIPWGVSDKRLKMKLVDGVAPNELWRRDHIRGDIVVLYKRVGTELVPTEIHLTRVL